jgi:hypothetical protein
VYTSQEWSISAIISVHIGSAWFKNNVGMIDATRIMTFVTGFKSLNSFWSVLQNHEKTRKVRFKNRFVVDRHI